MNFAYFISFVGTPYLFYFSSSLNLRPVILLSAYNFLSHVWTTNGNLTQVIDKNGIREIDLTDIEGNNPADSMKE